MSVHDKAILPRTKAEALLEASDADEHAQECRTRDMHGSARQFEPSRAPVTFLRRA